MKNLYTILVCLIACISGLNAIIVAVILLGYGTLQIPGWMVVEDLVILGFSVRYLIDMWMNN